MYLQTALQLGARGVLEYNWLWQHQDSSHRHAVLWCCAVVLWCCGAVLWCCGCLEIPVHSYDGGAHDQGHQWPGPANGPQQPGPRQRHVCHNNTLILRSIGIISLTYLPTNT